MPPLHYLLRALNYTFQQPALLKTALTHKSYGQPHSERLEFLGDSLLNCTIANALFVRFPQLDEGRLSRLRAGLVNQDSLAQLAIGLNLGDYLYLGEGERKAGGFRRPSILADALEAIFGAIFLDSGDFKVVQQVIEHLYTPSLTQLNPNLSGKDAKSKLQEYLQGKRYAVPMYTVTKIEGEGHAQSFTVSCLIEKLACITYGEGATRRIAETLAAQAALKKLFVE
jgi:ribonuclease-3